MPRIAIVADFDPSFEPHPATEAALAHSAQSLGVALDARWITTPSLIDGGSEESLAQWDGFFIAPGSPYKSLAGAIRAIRFAREQRRPLIGTCGGFQHVIIECARNVLGVVEAQHAEYDPDASRLLINSLSCSLAGKTLLIDVLPGSLAAAAYGRSQVAERYYCSFGLNPAYRTQIEQAGLRTTGVEAGDQASQGDARIMELDSHPFYVATLFVPQMRSAAGSSHPLIDAFVRATSSQLR